MLKKIKKGELLYYDYNAGGFDEYPTENFVWKSRNIDHLIKS